MKHVFLFISVVSLSFILGVYNVGQTISISDQNITSDVCNGENPFNGSDEFKLADLNGDLNGGYYHVIHLDLAAAW